MQVSMNRGWVCASLILLALLLSACGEQESSPDEQQGQPSPPKSAQVMEMARQDIALDKSYPAMLRSDNRVTLVARVEGILEQRHFEPGQEVEKGELLYTIEPEVYEAQVRQREADLQSAEAEEYRASRDAARFERLIGQGSISRQEYDQAQAELRVAKARVAQAQAALDSARVNLEYTEVSAPVSGSISLSEVNVGNLVRPGMELATITPLNPLEVRFQLPQRDAFELRRQRAQENRPDIKAVLEFPDVNEEDPGSLEGELDYLGSQVSEATSTVQARATFTNPRGLFLPGQFVRVRLEGMKRFGVLAVPEIALTQGLMGPQVYVLEGEVARARDVTVGETAGPWEIISEGLEPGDRVIVSDPANIDAGMNIDPQPFDGDAERLPEAEQEAEQEPKIDPDVETGMPAARDGN